MTRYRIIAFLVILAVAAVGVFLLNNESETTAPAASTSDPAFQ